MDKDVILVLMGAHLKLRTKKRKSTANFISLREMTLLHSFIRMTFLLQMRVRENGEYW